MDNDLNFQKKMLYGSERLCIFQGKKILLFKFCLLLLKFQKVLMKSHHSAGGGYFVKD